MNWKNKLIISICYIVYINGAPVSLESVLRITDNILEYQFPIADNFQYNSFDLVSDNGEELFYIVNISPKGFILVSADDKLYPLLGYSYESDYSIDNIPLQFESMLESFKEQIHLAIINDFTPANEIVNAWDSYLNGNPIDREFRSVSPLITANWDQGNPWNDMCPEDMAGPGGNALVGCVAVSMAQVMHYWSYPEIGYGSHSYYHPDYGTLSANFGATNYDFDNMPNNNGTTAVQTLLYHAGVAVDMDYGSGGSGAWVGSGYPCAMTALRDYFLYNDDMQFRYKNSYSWDSWRNLLKDELNNGRPLVYRGYSGSGGHAWNIDGYEDDLFHCNWGWGGYYNGYFYINELNPGGDSFTGDMAVIIGIQPESLTIPNLVLTEYNILEFDGDGDLVLNPGETGQVYFTLENLIPWPDAEGVDIILTTDEPEINIVSDYVFADLIPSGETYSNIGDPFILYASEESDIKEYNLMVTVATSIGDENYYKEFPIILRVSLDQMNFPIPSNTEIVAAPLVIDIDNNGSELEIIYADNSGLVHVVDQWGEERDNWPFNSGDDIWGSPAVADIDSDGELEIVITSKSKYMYVIDTSGNVESYYNADQFLMGTPAIGNIDNDDELEIIFAGYTPSGDVFAVNHDGSLVEGFPAQINEKVLKGVALYDINSNGKDDIIISTESDNLIIIVYDDGTWDTIFSASDKFRTAPSIIINNNEPVILAGNNNGSLYALTPDGSIVFIYETSGSITTSVGFLEIDNSTAGIFFGSEDGYLYGIDQYGFNLPGWPINCGGQLHSTPSINDLDGDGYPEIISATTSGKIIALQLDGTFYPAFPINYEFGTNSSPMVVDLDNDNDLEIMIGTTGALVGLDIKQTGFSEEYWNMYRGNTERTGVFEVELEAGLMGDLNGDYVLDILDIVINVNIVLEEIEPTMYQLWAGDINEDGGIDILDIIQLVNLILF